MATCHIFWSQDECIWGGISLPLSIVSRHFNARGGHSENEHSRGVHRGWHEWKIFVHIYGWTCQKVLWHINLINGEGWPQEVDVASLSPIGCRACCKRRDEPCISLGVTSMPKWGFCFTLPITSIVQSITSTDSDGLDPLIIAAQSVKANSVQVRLLCSPPECRLHSIWPKYSGHKHKSIDFDSLYSVPRNCCNVCDFQHSLLIPLQPKLQKNSTI